MTRTIILSAIALAAGAFVLQWLEYQYLIRSIGTEFYIVILCAGFTALGLWAGHRLTAKKVSPDFELNEAAIASLGVTAREMEVLAHLAAGASNKEMARVMGVSPNTVKTHLASLYDKLDVSRRTQAVGRARELHLIP